MVPRWYFTPFSFLLLLQCFRPIILLEAKNCGYPLVFLQPPKMFIACKFRFRRQVTQLFSSLSSNFRVINDACKRADREWESTHAVKCLFSLLLQLFPFRRKKLRKKILSRNFFSYLKWSPLNVNCVSMMPVVLTLVLSTSCCVGM